MGVERQTMLEPSAPDPRSLGAFIEPGPMSAFADPARRAIVGDAAGLERELLRRGVGALTADRNRCAEPSRSAATSCATPATARPSAFAARRNACSPSVGVAPRGAAGAPRRPGDKLARRGPRLFLDRRRHAA